MDLPGGQLIVGAIGVAIAAIGVALIRKAYTEKFDKKIDARASAGRAAPPTSASARWAASRRASRSGSSAACSATRPSPTSRTSPAASTRPSRRCSSSRFGPFLLAAIALGFAAYGLFCFAQARYFDHD